MVLVNPSLPNPLVIFLSQVQRPAQLHNPCWQGLDSGHEDLADKEGCKYADCSTTSDVYKEVDAGIEAGDCPEGGQEIEYGACRAIAKPDSGCSSEGDCGSVAGESWIGRKIENGLRRMSCALSYNGVIDQEGARPRIRPRIYYFHKSRGYSNGDGSIHYGSLEAIPL